MELPQQRPYGTQTTGGGGAGGGGGGGGKATQDFLSLCSHSTMQQDPKPPSQGGHLKTHDFLRLGKTIAKEETNEISIVEKSRPPPAPPTLVEHILPGGIGTYSINHTSYFNPMVPKPEVTVFNVARASSPENKNEQSSNCSSYTAGSGFTLWEESTLKKGKTWKEDVVRGAAAKTGWTASDRPSPSSSNNHRNCFSSLSPSQQSGQKSQSFMEMIKSAKGSTYDDDDLDDDEEIVLKQESPSPVHTGELRVKVDGNSIEQNVNTPRSKHSVTEQRRRSKINDRFQMLREIIPRSDQKRDKASFLLEVIKYIEFLQEKVQKYEAPYQGWNQEPTKLMTWENNSRPGASSVDRSRGISSGAGPALLFGRTLDEKNNTVSPTIPGIAQNLLECGMSSEATLKAMDQQPGITDKATSFPTSLPPNSFCPGRTGGAVAQFAHGMASDAENMTNQPQPQSCLTRSCVTTGGPVSTDKLKEQEPTIESGTISISSMYSQGLLNTLRQALQSSGVDLSLASISVQIELGKQDNEVPPSYQKTMPSRISSGEESDQARKKLKTVTR